MGTTNTPGDLVSPLLGPVQTAGERAARAEAEEQLGLTAESITDEQIRGLRDSLPDGHVDAQWCDDALGSHHHRLKRLGARRICAEIINERTAGITQPPITDDQIRALRNTVRQAEGAQAEALCIAAAVTYLDDIEGTCDVALNPRCGLHYRKARALCAQILKTLGGAL